MGVPPRVDAALAGALLATGLLEVVINRGEYYRPIPAALSALVGGAAMLVRSRHPVICLAVFVALVFSLLLPGIGPGLTFAVVVGCLFALANVGRRCADRTSVPAVVATTGVFTVGSAFSARPWDVVVVLLGCGTAWGTGRLLRREAERNVELTALATDLAAEREARAREAVSAERTRIARELHDAVAHTVSVMTIHAAGVRRRLDTDPDRARERDMLLDVERLGREAVAELHRAVGVLRDGSEPDGDAVLAPSPRLADLEQLTARVRAAGVPVDVRVEGRPRPLPGGLEQVAYRVVQEALTNTLKHAGPARAEIEVTYGDTHLGVAVLDDGRGREDAVSDRGYGHGLAGMRERAALYGGSVEAGPNRGGGYTVRVMLPLPQGVSG